VASIRAYWSKVQLTKSRRHIGDQVAIVGVGVTPYVLDAQMSVEALAIEAAQLAMRDAGLAAHDIDGICGSYSVPAHCVQSALGVGEVVWYENPSFPPAAQVMCSLNAILSGMCETVLCYHAAYRAPGVSRAAATDPMRQRSGLGMNVPGATPESITSVVGYAAWASRHFYEFGTARTDLGLISINARSHAIRNPHALMRKPLTMEEYLSSRLIREPFGILDMDYPVDGADALILTTTERAKDMPHRPVLIHAAAMAQRSPCEPDQMMSFARVSSDIVAERLWAQSDIQRDAVDLLYLYDGFTIIPLVWLESLGYCRRGEGKDLLRSSWSQHRARFEIAGALLNTHGGSLSEGGTQGMGLLREAVVQLRQTAGERQSARARTAVVTPGGFVQNAAGFIFHAT
jgi:acetyl-CoA acetyltransferase